MNATTIPENAVGHVGMVAALKRVNEADVGKLVALREPVGFVTTLVGSDKPVFAWLALPLGEPIDCNGKKSRSVYVADRCLIPISDMTDDEVETISRSQADSDFKAALAEMKEILEKCEIKPGELGRFVDKAAAEFSISRVLEVVAVPVALREIGFYPSPQSDEVLLWTGIHAGMELHFQAGNQWIDRWVLVGSGKSRRQAVWDERALPNEAPRGKIVKTILDIWRSAFLQAPVPDCLALGAIYERHQKDMQSINLALPRLSLDPKVFRAVLKWIRSRHIQSANELLTLSYSDGLLRLDVEGIVYGCPGRGQWVDDCKVFCSDLMELADRFGRVRSIQMTQGTDHILVNEHPVVIQA
ncbi:hypothetical protein [Sideroxydans sp. CL21]|uniref:hypothetical protein n=1 Tax=Sideroxydans sp. CL21 TaxID=2600596 RepID=UPI0024BC0F29|nr:hypothetical protein [Sideroxydans sp. CL21]